MKDRVRDKIRQRIVEIIDDADIEDPSRGLDLWKDLLGDIADDILAIPEIVLKEKADAKEKEK